MHPAAGAFKSAIPSSGLHKTAKLQIEKLECCRNDSLPHLCMHAIIMARSIIASSSVGLSTLRVHQACCSNMPCGVCKHNVDPVEMQQPILNSHCSMQAGKHALSSKRVYELTWESVCVLSP